MLDVAVAQAGRAPEHTVTDQGVQFGEEYLDWCERAGVKPRHGGVGERGTATEPVIAWSTLPSRLGLNRTA
jgi:hypothetical protein